MIPVSKLIMRNQLKYTNDENIVNKYYLLKILHVVNQKQSLVSLVNNKVTYEGPSCSCEGKKSSRSVSLVPLRGLNEMQMRNLKCHYGRTLVACLFFIFCCACNFLFNKSFFFLLSPS